MSPNVSQGGETGDWMGRVLQARDTLPGEGKKKAVNDKDNWASFFVVRWRKLGLESIFIVEAQHFTGKKFGNLRDRMDTAI